MLLKINELRYNNDAWLPLLLWWVIQIT